MVATLAVVSEGPAKRWTLGLVLAVAVLGTGCSGTSTPPEVFKDVAYSSVDARQALDVYIPGDRDGPYPTILAIHGGGFTARSKNLYAEIGHQQAEQGFAFVAINYRLSPDNSYPAQVEDSFCALAWVHEHAAEYGFDTDRVVVWGGSAGGYLASMVATEDDPSRYLSECPHQDPSTDAVAAAVIFYGFYDFRNVDDYPPGSVNGSLRFFWGAKHEDIPSDRLEEMSPISHIDGSEPPFIIFHGTKDIQVPSVMSERFAAALRDAGVDVELVLLRDVRHAFETKPIDSDEMTEALHEMETFLDRTLNR